MGLHSFVTKLGVVFLCFALGACGAKTQMLDKLEEQPATGAADEKKDGGAGFIGAEPYAADVASSTEELYGEPVAEAETEAFKEAVESEPTLAYNVIYFDYNRSTVKQKAIDLLKRHGQHLHDNPDVHVVVEGHADQRGSAGYNLALGERRALAAKSVLIGYGASEGQLAVISYGEERPAVDGDSDEAFSKNRRVELIYQ